METTGFDKREDAGELRGQTARPETGGAGNRVPSPLAIWLIPKGTGEVVLFVFFLWEKKQRKAKPLGSAGRDCPHLAREAAQEAGPLRHCLHCGLKLPISTAR